MHRDVMLGLLLAALPAVAGAGPWRELPAEQRALLAPIAASWDRLPPERQQELAERAAHWLALDESERERLRARHADWLTRPPTERAALRERAAAWAQRPPEEQARLLAARQRLLALPETERQTRRQAFEALPPAQRAELLLPAGQRAAAALARELFGFVPPEQRDATLAMLAELSPEARTDLERRLRRMPPAAREALRKQLLGLEPAARRARLAGE